MKIKYKKQIIFCLVFSMLLLTACKPLNVQAIDNYSTYLYNQSVNIDNDSAHLLSENADGSNGYRNLFQSNFLFPSKLNNDMLSTTKTDSFSHYSFNQFHFNNLDNIYNYQSSNSSKNKYSSIESSNIEIENGNLLNNKSVNNNDSEFGKYNATYTFDDYNETKSNFGNYNGTYSFENEVGYTNESISFIDIIGGSNSKIEVLSSYLNHKSVLNFSTDSAAWNYIRNYDISHTSGFIEFWCLYDTNVKSHQITLRETSSDKLMLSFHSNTNVYAYNGTWINLGITYNPFEWYHVRIEFDCTSNWNIIINGVDLGSYSYYGNPSLMSALHIEQYGKTYTLLDAIGFSFDSNYNENDNTNAYGIQSELENDFLVSYDYSTYISIVNDNIYHNNILNLTDTNNGGGINPLITNVFDNSQESGIIEFYLKTTDISEKSQICLIDSTESIKTWFYIQNSKFQYYDGSIKDIPNVDIPENDYWHHISIYFDCSIDKISYTIDGISSGELDFAFATTDITGIAYYSDTNNNLYSTYVSSMDFSWSIGYYENRINDIVPLTNNYKSIKSENSIYESNHNSQIYANLDYEQEWVSSLTNHSDSIRYDDSDSIAFSDLDTPNIIDGFGFSNIMNNYSNAYKIQLYMKLYSALSGSAEQRQFYYTFYNGSSWKDYESTGVLSLGYNYLTIDWNENLSLSELNNIQIKLKSPNSYYTGNFLIIYQLYINIFHYNQSILFISENNISYSNETPVLHTLHYSLTNSMNDIINISIYNYDLTEYYLINSYKSYLEFIEYTFILNESAYFRNNIFKIKIECFSNYQVNLFIDKLILNITYGNQNNNGYQKLLCYNYFYDSVNTELGYMIFELRIYNNCIMYKYSEINYYKDNYEYDWIIYNTSNIELTDIELQLHCRYGLNTLDVEIINLYAIIYLNYNSENIIEFREQSRKELNAYNIKSSFNYTAMNNNYLNLTGIIGNYSYCSFNGMRSLYGSASEIFHRYFDIPYFSQDIDITIPIDLDYGSISNPDEPDLPTSTYWTYQTYRTSYYQDINVPIGNWTLQFSQMKAETYTAKYPYTTETISKDYLGSWHWKIKFNDDFSYTISFNFMRNAIVSILNAIFLLWQLFQFWTVAGASYIFMYVGCSILSFIWNYLIYALWYVGMIVLWYLYEGLYLLIQGLVWFYEYVIIPFLYWVRDYLLPILIEAFIYYMAWAIALGIYVITWGNIDLIETQQLVYDILWIIVIELYNWIITFVNNIVYLLLFVLWYIICVLYLYLRYLIARGRGFKENAERYYYTLQFFIIPLRFIADWIKELLGITPYL